MSDKPSAVKTNFMLNEDWLSVIIAFVLILLAKIGILGKTGIHIKF
jgi:hypothetical protein